jgi:hypothetical protein
VHATNRGGDAGWQVGTEVRLGFAAEEAMALPMGPLAADA